MTRLLQQVGDDVVLKSWNLVMMWKNTKKDIMKVGEEERQTWLEMIEKKIRPCTPPLKV